MSCYLCGGLEYVTVLNQSPIPIWTNASDGKNGFQKIACILRQCKNCGHVYQPVNDTLRQALTGIYSSSHAQLSTSMGKGNWGQERCRAFLEIFLKMVNIKGHDSVFEIGCDDGYLLKALKDHGAQNLAGIEPSSSLPQTMEKEGVLLMKGFAREDLVLPRQYSLIFSSGVFEHIENLGSMMRFCLKNLKPEGELFFSVPDAEQYIDEADPAMFTHEHVQYFTENSVRRFLAQYGFSVKSLVKEKDGLEVLSQRTSQVPTCGAIELYTDYENRMTKVLAKVRAILKGPGVIVHAANNALNNILGWLNEDFDFTLVDNDATKHGKRYFGKTIQSLDRLNLGNYSKVLIIPNAFHAAIRAGYLQRGFKGDIEDLFIL